jgi:hypothetical protein
MDTTPCANRDEAYSRLLNDPHYQITSTGQITKCLDRGGYVTETFSPQLVHLSEDNKLTFNYHRRMILVHKLIYIKFQGTIPKHHYVIHLDGNPQHNDITNLKLMRNDVYTRYRKNTLGIKPVRARCKLNEKQVYQLKEERKLGISMKDLALKYSVSKSTVSYICAGRTWKEINPNPKPELTQDWNKIVSPLGHTFDF